MLTFFRSNDLTLCKILFYFTHPKFLKFNIEPQWNDQRKIHMKDVEKR